MKLLNKHRDGSPRYAIYIGRGSPLGNPYRIGEHGTRAEVIDKYRIWLRDQLVEGNPAVVDAMRNLQDNSSLLCFCHPNLCHGSVIEEYWYEIMACGDFDMGLRNYRQKWNKNLEQEYRAWLVEKLVSRDPTVTIDFREQILSHDLVPEKYRKIKLSSVLIPLHRELTADGNYDSAIQELAKKEGFLHTPNLDGVTHINVYSKGITKLGRALSNFAPIPFEHPKDGRCASVEGYWYYLKSGRQYPYLKELYGVNAKQEGKKYPRVDDSDFIEDIKTAITCKIVQNPELEKDFKESTLPFTHYYWYGSVMDPKVLAKDTDKWMVDHLEDLRTSLRKGD